MDEAIFTALFNAEFALSKTVKVNHACSFHQSKLDLTRNFLRIFVTHFSSVHIIY